MTMTLSRKQNKIAKARGKTPDFDALFQEHWGRLCSVLYRIVGDWAEAEDLALDTFLRLYQRPPAETHNLGGWLYRVATHLGLNALRSRQRRQHYEEQAAQLAVNERTPADPETTLQQTQEQQQVRAVLSKMKPRTAQMLLLRHSGLSYAEIAAALQIAPGSVGTLLTRAERDFEKRYQAQTKLGG